MPPYGGAGERRPADPGIARGPARDARHRGLGQRRVQRQEHLPVRRPGRPPVTQVTRQRPADVGRQRNLIDPVSLAPDRDAPCRLAAGAP
jgi:hypothetical protein